MASKSKKTPSKKQIGKEIVSGPAKQASVFAPVHELSWEADDFRYYPKNRLWALGIGVMALALIWAAVILEDYLVAAICIVAAIVFFQHGYAKPKKREVKLAADGISFRGQSYLYTNLKSFWIVEEPEKMLYLEQAKFSFPLTVTIQDKSAEEVRTFLCRYLPEHPTATTEHVTDRLSRMLRF